MDLAIVGLFAIILALILVIYALSRELRDKEAELTAARARIRSIESKWMDDVEWKPGTNLKNFWRESRTTPKM